ncbi:MAG TPA: PHB depolymerase family esterase [Gemmatimonadaceae bacterium]|nr:PHB depolymerase family esterase [Gemmatimonadaceae bacterium]
MKIKTLIVGALSVIFGVPVALILTIVVTVHFLNRTNGRLISSGQEREYLLYVPRSYDRARPTPLIISMHGAAGWPAQQRNLTHWNRLADSLGFIVVYPAGTDRPPIWHVERSAGLERDVKFISELIDSLEASYNIDSTMIFANGLSNGGGMSFVLSCRLSNRIAAVGLVSAAQTLPASWCTSDQPVPMIAFHGTGDPIVPYDGGQLGDPFNPAKVLFPSVRSWVTAWARRNRCAPNPIDSVVTSDVTRSEYTGCAHNATVVLYSVDGGGHAWPGGKPLPRWWVGRTTNTIDATKTMWAFFKDHPLRGTQVVSR